VVGTMRTTRKITSRSVVGTVRTTRKITSRSVAGVGRRGLAFV
jgi:hypothetical protein